MAAVNCYSVFWIFLMGIASHAVVARKLPLGLMPCSRNLPDLNACALRNGRLAIQHVIPGIPAYQVPVIDPLHISLIDIGDPMDGRQVALSLAMHEVDITGLSSARLDDMKVDLQQDFMSWECFVPRVSLLGRYNVTGRVLVLPLRGHGPMNVTLDDLVFKFRFGLARSTHKDGRQFVTPRNSSLTFETKRAYIHLDNLFDGERALSDQMNVFLNENWREMVQELGPPIAEALSVAVTQIIAGIAKVVPYDNIFPDTPPPSSLTT